MDGIHKAVEQNFERVKINCVVMRGLNDDELVNFVKLAQDMVRFLLPILQVNFASYYACQFTGLTRPQQHLLVSILYLIIGRIRAFPELLFLKL